MILLLFISLSYKIYRSTSLQTNLTTNLTSLAKKHPCCQIKYNLPAATLPVFEILWTHRPIEFLLLIGSFVSKQRDFTTGMYSILINPFENIKTHYYLLLLHSLILNSNWPEMAVVADFAFWPNCNYGKYKLLWETLQSSQLHQMTSSINIWDYNIYFSQPHCSSSQSLLIDSRDIQSENRNVHECTTSGNDSFPTQCLPSFLRLLLNVSASLKGNLLPRVWRLLNKEWLQKSFITSHWQQFRHVWDGGDDSYYHLTPAAPEIEWKLA